MPIARKQPRSRPLVDTPEPTPAEQQEDEQPETVAKLSATKWRNSEGLLSLAGYKALTMWRLMEVMTENDWEDKLCYLYRLFPRAINRETGSHSHITKLAHGVSIDDIQNTYGGGRFKLWLKDPNGNTLKKINFETHGKAIWTTDEIPEAPPEPQEEDDEPKGRDDSAEIVRLFLEKERRTQEEAGNTPAVESLREAIALISEGARAANKMLADGSKPAALEQLQFVAGLVQQSSGMKDKLLDRLLDRLQEREQPRGQRMEDDEEEGDPFDKFLARVDKIRKLGWAGEGSLGNGGGSIGLGAALVQALPDLVKGIKEIALEFARSRALVVGRYGAGLGNQDVQPSSSTAAPAPSFEALPAKPPAVAAAQDLEQRLFQTKQWIVRMYGEGDPADVIGRLIQLNCPEMFENLARRDDATVLQMAKLDPLLGAIANTEEFPAFVHDLLDYARRELAGGGQPESEPEPTPPEPVVQ